MDELKVKTVLSGLTKGGQPCFQLYVKNSNPMSQEDFVKKFAERLGKTAAEARFINDVHGQVFSEAVITNRSVNTGSMRAYLAVLGSVESAGAAIDKATNPVKCIMLTHGELKAAVDGILAVNDTKTIEAILYTVQYGESEALNTIEGTTDPIKLNGVGLILTLSNNDEGVWLEKDGVMVSDKATIVKNDTNTINCTFAELPADGDYKLVISTRNGESKDDYGVVRLERNVKVITAA